VRWLAASCLMLSLCCPALAGELAVAFNLDKPPYAFSDTGGGTPAGIEIDLMRAVLGRAGYAVQVRAVSKNRLLLSVANREVDVAATVQGSDDSQVYFSDDLVEFSNVVISRKSSELKIDRLEDLDKVRFVIWNRGWGDLGPVFESKYKPDARGRFRPNYYQSTTQDMQARVFWLGRVDAIVIDRVIFAWYKRELSSTLDVQDELVIHNIFKSGTWFKAAFHDRAVRDRFNAALRSMKGDGSYQRILDKYK
jgi:polar amino acid transport system substrate-binding protein